MAFFVISVQPSAEHEFLTIGRKALDPGEAELYFPQRALTIRKKGKKKEVLAPVFPGYVFLKTEEISDTTYRSIKRVPGFYRFLESNTSIRPLNGEDLRLVTHFWRFGEVIGKSTVKLDEKSRIRVLNGPLEGLEGQIVKIDKRKQRAKVKLDLYSESFLIDFGLELLGTGTERSTGQA
jgi:transcriptional antiterminator NusG